jgi:DNA-binding MarR family transcriptional regulator
MAAYTNASFEPDRSLGYLLKRVHADAVALHEPLFERTALTYTQFAALAAVVFGSGRTCAQLARDLNHDMGATSRIIGVLEERGLLTRARDPDDRRVLNLSVTEAGYAQAADARDMLVAQWNRWLADWSTQEVETLIAGLQRLRATLADARGDVREEAA